MNREEIIQENVERFGSIEQVVQAIQEMGELIQVLTKIWLGKPQQETNLVEELADAEIMIKTLKYIYKCRYEVEKEIDRKLERVQKHFKKSRPKFKDFPAISWLYNVIQGYRSTVGSEFLTGNEETPPGFSLESLDDIEKDIAKGCEAKLSMVLKSAKHFIHLDNRTEILTCMFRVIGSPVPPSNMKSWREDD